MAFEGEIRKYPAGFPSDFAEDLQVSQRQAGNSQSNVLKWRRTYIFGILKRSPARKKRPPHFLQRRAFHVLTQAQSGWGVFFSA